MEQLDSDMSFFLRSPSAEAAAHENSGIQKISDKDTNDNAYDEMLLDQEDDFSDINGKYKASQTQKSSLLAMADIPSTIPKPKATQPDDYMDDGDLEITDVQEKDKGSDLKRTIPAVFKNATRGRSITMRPTVKMRKVGSETEPHSYSKLSFLSQTDKSIEPLLAAISNLQGEKLLLQSELNSYISKYEMTESKLTASKNTFTELKNRIETYKQQQNSLESNLTKMNDKRANDMSQMNALVAEKNNVQKSISELKKSVTEMHSSSQEYGAKLSLVSREISPRKIISEF